MTTSVDTEIGIVAGKDPGSRGQFAGKVAQDAVDVSLVGQVQLTIDDATHDIASARTFGGCPGIEPGLLGVRKVDIGSSHNRSVNPARTSPRAYRPRGISSTGV